MSEPSVRDGGGTTILGRADANPKAPLPRKGDHAVYRFVEPSTVPEHRRRKARNLVDQAAARLSLGSVRVRYFEHHMTVPAEDVPEGRLEVMYSDGLDPADFVFGNRALTDRELTVGTVRRARPDEICLLASLRGALLAHTIGHEVRHLRQFRDGMRGDLEPDAHTYATRFSAEVA